MSNDPSNGTEVADLSIDAKNTVIASDRTGGGEQRHGPVDGGSSASDDPETKDRNTPAAAQIAAAVIDRIPAARGGSGGIGRRSSATRSGSGLVWRQASRRSGAGGGLDRRAGGEEHQGEGKLSSSRRRPRQESRSCSEGGAMAVLAIASSVDGVGAGYQSEGSAGGWRDNGRVGEAPVGPTMAAGNAIRGRRSSGALSAEAAVETLQNGGNGEVALRAGRSGGGGSAGRQSGGGGVAGQRRSGHVPSPLVRLGRACRGRRPSGVLAAAIAAAALQDGGNDGGGPARRRRRRRQLSRRAATWA